MIHAWSAWTVASDHYDVILQWYCFWPLCSAPVEEYILASAVHVGSYTFKTGIYFYKRARVEGYKTTSVFIISLWFNAFRMLSLHLQNNYLSYTHFNRTLIANYSMTIIYFFFIKMKITHTTVYCKYLTFKWFIPQPPVILVYLTNHMATILR